MDFCHDPPQSFFTPARTQAANRKAGAGPLHRRRSAEPTCWTGTETEARSCLREQAQQDGRGNRLRTAHSQGEASVPVSVTGEKM